MHICFDRPSISFHSQCIQFNLKHSNHIQFRCITVYCKLHSNNLIASFANQNPILFSISSEFVNLQSGSTSHGVLQINSCFYVIRFNSRVRYPTTFANGILSSRSTTITGTIAIINMYTAYSISIWYVPVPGRALFPFSWSLHEWVSEKLNGSQHLICLCSKRYFDHVYDWVY